MEIETQSQLKAFYNHDDDCPLDDEIMTHDGRWVRRDADVYEWHPHEELSVPYMVSLA